LIIGVATVVICLCLCLFSAGVWSWKNTTWSYNRIELDEDTEKHDPAEEEEMIQMSVVSFAGNA
jgi:hypothetical protein